MITETKDLRHLGDLQETILEAEYFLATARVKGCGVFKLLHTADKQGLLLRRALRRHKAEGKILFRVKGEEFSHRMKETQYLIDRYPFVEDDEDLDKQNPEITVVCVR